MRHQGKITSWKDEKGFGFILPNSGSDRVFAHIKSFKNRQRRPAGNEIVTYELRTGANGRTQAENIAFVDDPARATSPAERGRFAIWFTAAFLIFIMGAAFTGKLPLAILGLYLVASAIAFTAYALDKSAATNNQWRIAENTLHLFALLGGWPGALAAQRLLRHKSRKQSFQIAFWTTVVFNCGVLAWLFSPSGAAILRSVFEATKV